MSSPADSPRRKREYSIPPYSYHVWAILIFPRIIRKGVPGQRETDGCQSRHVFITFNFVSLLMKPGFVSLDACSILPASERITDLPGKVVDFERFLDKMHPFLQHAVMNDDV